MKWLLAGLLALTALAGCVDDEPGGSEPEPEPRWSTEAWMAAISEERFATYSESLHYLEAEDGTSLALTLFLPDGLGDEQVPTLLELTPYQTLDRGLGSVFGGGAGGVWEDAILRGAAFVRADERGGHASGGCLDFGGEADRSDARVFHEWIISQPWSDGRVVTDGVSHPGMGSVVAHVAVPGLTAALTHAPVVSYYQDEWLQGAKFEDQLNGPAYQAIELAPTTYPDAQSILNQAAPCTGETTLDYSADSGQFGPLWQERHLALALHAAMADPATAPTAPILLTHGFVDENVHPDHSQMYWDALPDDYPKYAVFGWWYHGYPDMDGHPAQTFGNFRMRWLDATLHGIDNGLWLEPRLLVEDSQGVWHESHDWPIDGSQATTFWPHEGDLAAAAPASEGGLSYLDSLGAGRMVWTNGHVAFRSEPLGEAALVNGAPSVDLVASSTEAETKWVVYLMDEAPDGSWTRISHGYADSRMRDPLTDEWLPMTPGQPDTWTIPLQPTAVVVEEGHRLTLVIASQDSQQTFDQTMLLQSKCMEDFRGGCYTPSGIQPATTAGRAINTVHTGPEGTTLTVHLVDPSAGAIPRADAA